jgi:hypothetical protein
MPFLPKAASALTKECFKDASHHFNGPKKDAGVTIYRHTVPSSFRKPIHIATISFQKHFVIGLAALGKIRKISKGFKSTVMKECSYFRAN